MKKVNRVNPLMTQAFIIWLIKIGYRGVNKSGNCHFYCEATGKNFPRDVQIMANGRLNKPATQLFEEFKKYKPFEGVA